MRLTKELLFTLLLCVSCKPPLGYGLLLWNKDNPDLDSGSALVLLSESLLRDSYHAKLLGANVSTEIPRFLVQRYISARAAKKSAQDYQDISKLFIQNARESALYVRAAPDSKARSLYRLRPKEVAKVIEASGQSVNIGQFEGKWYHILTAEGSSGYVFDAYLRVYEQEENQQKVIKDIERASVTNQFALESINNQNWYRSEDLDTVKAGYFRPLEIFLEDVLLIDTEEKKISYSLVDNFDEKNYTRSETSLVYDKVINIDDSSYLLGATGIFVNIFSPERITVFDGSYQNGNVQNRSTIDEQDLESLVEKLQKRNERHLLPILAHGNRLESMRYGQINLANNGFFSWENSRTLTLEGFLEASALPQGYVDFPYVLDQELSKNYQGVISFFFENGRREVSFLYSLNNNSLFLHYVNEAALESGIVNHNFLIQKRNFIFEITGESYIPIEITTDTLPKESEPLL